MGDTYSYNIFYRDGSGNLQPVSPGDLQKWSDATTYLDQSPTFQQDVTNGQNLGHDNIYINHDGKDFVDQNGNINWDPNYAQVIVDEHNNVVGVLSAAATLDHEINHAGDPNWLADKNTPDSQYQNKAERYAQEHANTTDNSLGEDGRFNHKGPLERTDDVTEHTHTNPDGSQDWVSNKSGHPTKERNFDRSHPNTPSSPSRPHPSGGSPSWLQKLLDFARRQISPLVLDLSGSGINLTPLSTPSPYFDLAASGFAGQTSWIGSGTGFLALDRNGNGQIDNGLELFGTAGGATDGFAALRALDANGDGVINVSDPQFANLRVWINPESDGIVHPGELQTLTSLGIISINLNATASTQVIAGDPIKLISSYTLADGTTRTIGDAWLTTDPTYTTPVSTPTIPATIAALPQLNGYGTLYDLQSAATKDGALASELQAIVTAKGTPAADNFAAVANLLLEWSNSTSVNPNSRGSYFDARQLDFIEKYSGVPFSDPSYGGTSADNANPRWASSSTLRAAWATIEDSEGARLLIQAGYNIPEFAYNASIDSVLPTQSLTTSIASIYARLGELTSANTSTWEAALRIADAARIDQYESTNDFLAVVAGSASHTVAAFAQSLIDGLTFTLGANGATITGVTTNSTLYAGFGIEKMSIIGQQSLHPATTNDVVYFGTGDGRLSLQIADYSDNPNNGLLITNQPVGSVKYHYDVSGNLDVIVGTGGEKVTVVGQAVAPSQGVQYVGFNDGTTLTKAQINTLADVGTAGSDGLFGTAAAEAFDGKGAPTGQYDFVNGGGGSDTFTYNVGYGALEILQNGAATDASKLVLGPGITKTNLTAASDATGDVTLSDGTVGDSIKIDGFFQQFADVGYGPNSVVLADGTILQRADVAKLQMTGTSAANFLYGTNDANTFDGKGAPAGQQDYVNGHGGNDVFNYSKGYGTLELRENGNSGDASVLVLGNGFVKKNLTFTSTPSNLIIGDGVAGDSIILDNYLYASNWGPQTITFSDKTSITKTALIQLAATGTKGADLLHGSTGAEVFDGLGAPAGQSDYINGGGGADTFNYKQHYGALEIYESGQPTDASVLKLGSGITATNLVVTSTPSNIILRDGIAGDSITLDNVLTSNYYGPQKVLFSNGTSLSLAQLIVAAATGTPGADVLHGTSGADTFDGKGAPAGQEDYENGGGGNDIFLYQKGYGKLEIYEQSFGSGTSEIKITTPGITAKNITATTDGAYNLFLSDGTAGDTIEIDAFYLNYGPQSLVFSDGSSLSRAALTALVPHAPVRALGSAVWTDPSGPATPLPTSSLPDTSNLPQPTPTTSIPNVAAAPLAPPSTTAPSATAPGLQSAFPTSTKAATLASGQSHRAQHAGPRSPSVAQSADTGAMAGTNDKLSTGKSSHVASIATAQAFAPASPLSDGSLQQSALEVNALDVTGRRPVGINRLGFGASAMRATLQDIVDQPQALSRISYAGSNGAPVGSAQGMGSDTRLQRMLAAMASFQAGNDLGVGDGTRLAGVVQPYLAQLAASMG